MSTTGANGGGEDVIRYEKGCKSFGDKVVLEA